MYKRQEQVFGGGENHPYTRGLLRCAPDLGELKPRLEPIPGHMPEPTRMPPGCAFAAVSYTHLDVYKRQPVVTGGQQEVLDYYGLNAGGIARAAYELCRR